ncbi:MAG TPA: hypothetical protein VNK43_01040 [Gemmatimonadales bacterium]|nr:hypothetical protein [Gemmatimonadales bacterium]
MTTIATASQLERLTGLDTGEHRVVTCYLKLAPRDRVRGKYQIKLKNRLRAVEQSLDRLGLTRAAQDGVREDLGRVAEYLRHPGNLPSSHGIAIFACGPLGLFETVPLPSVHRSRLAVDRTPLIRELASAEEEFGRYLAAVVDRTAARVFEITAFDGEELPGIHATSTRGSRFHGDGQGGPSGWGEHTYHNRIREEKQRHYAAVAQELFDLSRRAPVRGIVLAGPGTEAGAVRPFLHPYLAERVIGTAKLNPKDVTLAAVREATLAARDEYERATEREAVRRMGEALGSRWAVNGYMATLRALARGQVRVLLVDPDATMPGFRCSESGRLALTERECRGEGEPIPVLDVVDEAIEEALRQRVSVEVVYDAEARQRIDGLAALLRFR